MRVWCGGVPEPCLDARSLARSHPPYAQRGIMKGDSHAIITLFYFCYDFMIFIRGSGQFCRQLNNNCY